MRLPVYLEVEPETCESRLEGCQGRCTVEECFCDVLSDELDLVEEYEAEAEDSPWDMPIRWDNDEAWWDRMTGGEG